MKPTLFLLIITLGLFTPKVLFGQFNISTAYEIGYHQTDAFNDIIKKYNTETSFLEQEMDELRIMHGLQLGLYYNYEDLVGLFLNWKYRFNNTSSSGTDPTTMAVFSKDLFVRQNVFSLGLENNFGFIGYGATIDYLLSGVKIENNNTSKRNIFTESNYASTFFISLNSRKTNQIRISLRPYIQIPWTKYDLHKLDMELNESTSTEKIEEGQMNFGLMIVFRNGA